MKVKNNNSSESGKKKESIVSPNCCTKSSIFTSPKSRLSPYEQTKSRWSKGTEIQPVEDGGLSTDTTKPFSFEIPSTHPLSTIRSPRGVNKHAHTDVRSFNNLLTKSNASALEMVFLLMRAYSDVQLTSGEDSTKLLLEG